MLKKINFGLLALVLGLGLTITTSAFKPAKVDRQWYFIGDTPGESLDGSQYSLTPPSPSQCNSGEELPCYIFTPENVDDQTKLDSYISTTYGTNSAALNEDAPVHKAD